MKRAQRKEQELSENAKQLLKLIPNYSVGNTFLRRRLGWPDEEYWKARKELLNNGLIEKGKGRGGSVARVGLPAEPVVEKGALPALKEEPTPEVEAVVAPEAELVEDEAELYEPLKNWIDSTFGHPVEEVGDYFLVKVTASPSGRKRESGQWSRPDVTSVQVSTYDLVINPDVEVTSYEVKRYGDALNLPSVYEAASHSRWTHFTYLVVENSEKQPLVLSERFERELSRYGVGLIKMVKQNGTYKFEETLEPPMQIPGPKDLDELLKTFFTDDPRNLRKFKQAIGK